MFPINRVQLLIILCRIRLFYFRLCQFRLQSKNHGLVAQRLFAFGDDSSGAEPYWARGHIQQEAQGPDQVSGSHPARVTVFGRRICHHHGEQGWIGRGVPTIFGYILPIFRAQCEEDAEDHSSQISRSNH